MPATHYYLGRPANVLTAAMSRRGAAHSGAADESTAAHPAAATLAGRRPGGLTGARRMPPQAAAPKITAAPISAWAGHWFSARRSS
jgi:hypothetical protein